MSEHSLMLGYVMLLLAQGAASAPASQNDVTVVGKRAEKQLAACLARNCPPAEEIDASLQVSVEQFADGRYVDARRTLQAAIRRNRDHAADLPGPVSSLYATLATVAEHEGDANLWKVSARNNVLVLREHVGETNPATLREEFSFADSMFGRGMADAADGAYATIQRRAVAGGHTELAAAAAFRRGWLALMRERFDDAERFADEATGIAGADNKLFAELSEILHTRTAIQKGDDGAVDTLAARLRQSATEQPGLLFAPPVANVNPVKTPGLDIRNGRLEDSALRFADVGYWIRPDGKTAEVEILRNSGLGQWKPGILEQVGKRRYIPLDVQPGHPGLYRIDRFTVRGTVGTPVGTRIRQRMGDLSVHVVDLTETDAMSMAHRERTQGVRAGEGSGTRSEGPQPNEI